jgi:hypothetical protein
MRPARPPRRRLLIVGATLLTIVAACAAVAASVQTTPPSLPPPPQSQADCLASGGQWGRWGLSPREECNLPAPDAGRLCFASAACSGACLALAPVAPAGIGQCSARTIVLGCHTFVEDGIVQRICYD